MALSSSVSHLHSIWLSVDRSHLSQVGLKASSWFGLFIPSSLFCFRSLKIHVKAAIYYSVIYDMYMLWFKFFFGLKFFKPV